MSIGRILTGGLGSFGGRRYMPTLGYGSFSGAGEASPVFTTRLNLLGCSGKRLALQTTSNERMSMRGTSGKRLAQVGASR